MHFNPLSMATVMAAIILRFLKKLVSQYAMPLPTYSGYNKKKHILKSSTSLSSKFTLRETFVQLIKKFENQMIEYLFFALNGRG